MRVESGSRGFGKATYPAAVSFKVGVDEAGCCQSAFVLLGPAGACQRSALAGGRSLWTDQKQQFCLLVITEHMV